MRFLLLFLALVPSLLSAQVVVDGAELDGVELAVSGTLIPSQASECSAHWSLDEATNTTRVATVCESGTASDCDLTEKTGTDVGQDTTNHTEGSGMALFQDTDNEDLRCDFSGGSCDSLRTVAGGAALSWWAWIYPQDQCAGAGSGQSPCYIFKAFDFAGDGFDMARINSGDSGIRCRIDAAAISDGDTTLLANTLYFAMCTYANDADDEILVYVNGLDDDADTPGTATTRDTVDSEDNFMLSSNQSAQDWDGGIDSAGLCDQEFTAAEQCFICSCGLTNFRGCTYSGSSFVDEGVNDSLCNSCSLAGLDASDPIT